jgi:hypothetical protein
VVDSVWTAVVVTVLRQRVEAGASASEIANELSVLTRKNITRNAVIGKVHRLKGSQLSNAGNGVNKSPRARTPRAARRRAAKAAYTIARAAHQAAPKINETSVPRFQETKSTKPIPLTELTEDTCRWPMGGFADRPPYLYCGDPTIADCSYCGRHFLLGSKRFKETDRATTTEERSIAA